MAYYIHEVNGGDGKRPKATGWPGSSAIPEPKAGTLQPAGVRPGGRSLTGEGPISGYGLVNQKGLSGILVSRFSIQTPMEEAYVKEAWQ